MSMSDEISRRRITEVVHFTTHRGIVGVLATRVLKSRFRLPQDQYLQHVLHVNAANRPEAAKFFDKSRNWLDFVNLSFSEINRRYFDVSQRWHKDNDIWWAILSFDSAIATHQEVVFATTNNSYPLCVRGSGKDGLRSLFESPIARKPGWSVARQSRPDSLPTCEQAEVLYPHEVSTDQLRKIYVLNGEHHDLVAGWLREFSHGDVKVVIAPEKFVGKSN